MTEYDCTHCGRAPVLEDEIEGLKAENARLKALYNTKVVESGRLRKEYEQLDAEIAELRSDAAERWDEEARKEQNYE